MELVSIIINCIFFYSLLLLYHVSHASLRTVDKRCLPTASRLKYCRCKGLWNTNISFPFIKVGQE